MTHHTQDPEEMCLLEYQNRSKTSEKWVILIVLQFRYTFYKPTNLYTATDDDGNDVVK